MDKERLRYLLTQYIRDNAAWEEVTEMLTCLKSPGSAEILKSFIEASLKDETLNDIPVKEQAWDKMWVCISAATISPLQ